MGTSAVAGIVRITDNSGSQSAAADSIAISPKAVSEGYAPKNHASTSKDFGIATGARFGHVKLTDNLWLSDEDANHEGVALSAKAGGGNVIKEIISALNVDIRFLVTDADTAEYVLITERHGRAVYLLYTRVTYMVFYNVAPVNKMFMLFRWAGTPTANSANDVINGDGYVVSASAASLVAAGVIKSGSSVTIRNLNVGYYTLVAT